MGLSRKQKPRGRVNRNENRMILIGTEGNNLNKTERIYFNHFNRRGNGYIIRFARGTNSDPEGIVEDLIDSARELDIDTMFGDTIFCLVDTDNNPERCKAIESIRKKAEKNHIVIICSAPCFEVWFLQHFDYSTHAFLSSDEAVDSLKKYIPEYNKSKDIYMILEKRTNDAIQNAEKLEKYHDFVGNKTLMDRNPETDVYKVVRMLNEKF